MSGMLSTGYNIRLAREDELPLLNEIERNACLRFAEYPFATAMVEIVTPLENLETGFRAQCLWVATKDDQPVGFALAEKLADYAHLDELDVLPEHGQRGLGTALVETVCSWARQQGLSTITLSTLSNVPWNAPFYARHSFQILSGAQLSTDLQETLDEDAARGLPAENRVIMRREL